MKYQPIIGIEIHVQLNTASKCFCDCASGRWRDKPNTHTCPVCLGLPGALPVLNQQALEKAAQVGLALNCSVNVHTFFERKNYFYPDLPKGYQISQYREPLSIGGWIMVGGKRVRLNRAHLEEDTAKSIHTPGGTELDFNKSGIPLLEIVSEPDLNSAEEASSYCKEIQKVVRAVGASDCDMEKGQMRLEANISLAEKGDKELPDYRVEVKNINSFRYLEQAIEYEIERQKKALENSEELNLETRGFNSKDGVTYVQRSKEEAHDYRYFPEPDIPPLELSDNWIAEIEESLPELPAQKAERFVSDYDLRRDYALLLAEDGESADLFQSAVDAGGEAEEVANWIINRPADVEGVSADELADKIKQEEESVVEDEDVLLEAVQEAIKENPEAVEDYNSGKENAVQFLLGKVMGKTQGNADPQKTMSLLKKHL